MLRHSVRLKTLALAALATIGLTVSAAGPAHADNFIRLDNSPNGGTIDNTQTNSTITVYAHFCYQTNPFWQRIDTPRALTTVSGGHDFHWTATGSTDWANLRQIKVITSGTDWFWMDQLEVFQLGSEKWEWGIDNTVGACFSTQAGDGSNAVCYPNGSVSQLVFDVPSLNCGTAGI